MSETRERAWHRFLAAQTRRNQAADRVASMVSAGYRGGPTLNEAVADYDLARSEAEFEIESWVAVSEQERLAEIAAAGGVRAWWEARTEGTVTLSELALLDDDEFDVPFLYEVPC